MTNTVLKFKDGDEGGEYEEVSHVRIAPLDNGYLLEIDVGEDEIREAYTDKYDLLARIEELL